MEQDFDRGNSYYPAYGHKPEQPEDAGQEESLAVEAQGRWTAPGSISRASEPDAQARREMPGSLNRDGEAAFRDRTAIPGSISRASEPDAQARREMPGSLNRGGEANFRDRAAMPGFPASEPAIRYKAPIPEKPAVTPQTQPQDSATHGIEQRSGEWREPSYRQAHENLSNMYTPGIYIEPQPSRKRAAESPAEQKPRASGGLFRRFIRAACLVLLCAVLSGAVAYAVMEYRINRGDFTIIYENQVVLGGNSDNRGSSNSPLPIITGGLGLSAEDIYTMACTQVVSVSTRIEGSGGAFGGIAPGSSNVVAGSGFIISSEGYILTNYHVVETAYMGNFPLIVSLNDGTEFDAQVIGYERHNDVALLKIQASGLTPVLLADSDNIRVGQTVYAVGNPLGELVYTMTDGIISAKDREVSVEGRIINSFQFSAAVNSGNSGGPVYNVYGEVVGIVTAKPIRNSVEGIGFAIPVNDAIVIASELIEFGYITGRPLLGITADTVTSAHAEYWNWVIGVRVMKVNTGSAAENAGLLIGDIIIKLGEVEINSMETLRFHLRNYSAGDTERLLVWREGQEIEVTITFDEDLDAGRLNP